jgi:hypothetical protein
MDPQHRPLVSWPNHGARHCYGVPCIPAWVILGPLPEDDERFFATSPHRERVRSPLPEERALLGDLPAHAQIVAVDRYNQGQRWIVSGGTGPEVR